MTADLDPCPDAGRVGALTAWQHPSLVTCGACGRLIRFAWWTGTRHLCGACKRTEGPT